MEVVDPFAFITIECLIPATQHQLLSTTPFYRQDDFSPAAADYGDDNAWPVSSDDDDNQDGLPLPDDNNVDITFCSVPSTPDNQYDVVPSHSDEFQVNTNINLNDVVSGDSGECEGNPSSKLDDVVCGSTDELGFVTPLPSVRNMTGNLNDVVCANFDDLGLSVTRKRAREESSVTPLTTAKKLRFCDEAENMTSVTNDGGFGLDCCENSDGIQNDVVCESSGDLGLRFSDDGDKIVVENTEELVNDVVAEVSDELGLCTEERRSNDKIALENTEELVDDVVGEVPDELGFCTEERRGKENNEEVTDDVVSENSIDLGIKRDINKTNEKVVSPTTAEFIENTITVQNDVVSAKFVDSGERNVAEMEVEIENTAKIDCDTEEVDTEEVKEDDDISDNTEEINTSDNEDGNNNGNGDTEEVAEEEKCGDHCNCLMEVMKILAERSRKDKEGGKVDFLETAKRRGYTFPKPRWMSS